VVEYMTPGSPEFEEIIEEYMKVLGPEEIRRVAHD